MNAATKAPDYLDDKEFRRLSFDMMLAWESPDVASEVLAKVRQVFDNLLIF